MTRPAWQRIKRISTTNIESNGPFINGLRQDIELLNIKILNYNSVPTQKEKLSLLRAIYFEAKQVNERYPAPLLERHHKGYQEFLMDLPRQFASLDIDSLETEDALLSSKTVCMALLSEISGHYLQPDIALHDYVSAQKEQIYSASDQPTLTALQAQLQLRKLQECGRKECYELLSELKCLQFGTKDANFQRFFNSKKIDMNHSVYRAKTHDDIALIKEDIRELVQKHKSEMVVELQSVIAGFRKRAGLFTVGMNSKAQQIEDAMKSVPIRERIDFMHRHSAEGVLRALAAHRHPGKRGSELGTDGKINPLRASKSYQAFDAKFFADRAFDSYDEDNRDDSDTLGV